MGIPPHFGEHFASLLSSLFEVGLLPYQRSHVVVCNSCSSLTREDREVSTKWVENGKKKKGGNRIKSWMFFTRKGKWGWTFIPVVHDTFLLLEGFAFAFAVMLTMATDYNYRGVNNDSVSWCGRGWTHDSSVTLIALHCWVELCSVALIALHWNVELSWAQWHWMH